MSLYTFAAATLTTEGDRRRSAAIDQGQIVRTALLCLTLAGTAAMGYHIKARESATEGATPATHSATLALMPHVR